MCQTGINVFSSGIFMILYLSLVFVLICCYEANQQHRKTHCTRTIKSDTKKLINSQLQCHTLLRHKIFFLSFVKYPLHQEVFQSLQPY
jgi:hypothetical protein